MLSLKSELGPGFADLFSENRIFSEYLSFTLYGLLHRFLPNVRCRGRAVMLIPGFLAGDLSLGPLAGRLRELGCRVFFFRSLVQRGLPDSYHAALGKGAPKSKSQDQRQGEYYRPQLRRYLRARTGVEVSRSG